MGNEEITLVDYALADLVEAICGLPDADETSESEGDGVPAQSKGRGHR